MASDSSEKDGERAPSGLAGTVVKGAGMAAGGYALAQGLNLVVYLVLARLLTPEEFGVYAAATILLGFMAVISESGITSALIQRKDRIEEAMSTGAVWTLAAGLGLSLGALVLAPAIGLFFDDSQTGEIAAVMSGVVLLQTLTAVPSAILQRSFSFRRRMIIEPVQVVVFGAVAIVAAANGMGVWALVVGQYAGVAIDTLLSWALVSFRPRLRLASIGMWRELAGYGRHVFAGAMALRIGEQSDTAIVGKFLGAAPLGQFRYAFRLAMTPFQMLLAAAAYVLFPAFARITARPGSVPGRLHALAALDVRPRVSRRTRSSSRSACHSRCCCSATSGATLATPRWAWGSTPARWRSARSPPRASRRTDGPELAARMQRDWGLNDNRRDAGARPAGPGGSRGRGIDWRRVSAPSPASGRRAG